MNEAKFAVMLTGKEPAVAFKKLAKFKQLFPYIPSREGHCQPIFWQDGEWVSDFIVPGCVPITKVAQLDTKAPLT